MSLKTHQEIIQYTPSDVVPSSISISALEGLTEFEILDLFLSVYKLENSLSSAAEVDGLITAMLCDTTNVTSQQMIQLIWDSTGESSLSGPQWHNLHDKEYFERLLSNYIEESINLLASRDYQPVIEEFDTDSGATLQSYQLWGFGYITGFRQWEGKGLVDSPKNELVDTLTLIIAKEIVDLESAQLSKRAESRLNELIHKAFKNAVTLHSTELRSRNSSLHPPLSSVNCGRNDPCPCGSGRKYKKCCIS